MDLPIISLTYPCYLRYWCLEYQSSVVLKMLMSFYNFIFLVHVLQPKKLIYEILFIYCQHQQSFWKCYMS